MFFLVTEGFNPHEGNYDISKSIQTIQVVKSNHQSKEWNPNQMVQSILWSFETLYECIYERIYYVIRLNMKDNTFTRIYYLHRHIYTYPNVSESYNNVSKSS